MSREAFDKAKWHYQGNWPAGLPRSQAYVHTGMFVGWALLRGLTSDFFDKEVGAAKQEFRARRLTAPKLFEACDGAFTEDMLTPEGVEFTEDYFNFDGGEYLDDYLDLFDPPDGSPYRVADTWENFDRLVPTLDARLAEWRGGGGNSEAGPADG